MRGVPEGNTEGERKGWRLREEGMGQREKQKGGEEQIRNSTCGQTALLNS